VQIKLPASRTGAITGVESCEAAECTNPSLLVPFRVSAKSFPRCSNNFSHGTGVHGGLRPMRGRPCVFRLIAAWSHGVSKFSIQILEKRPPSRRGAVWAFSGHSG